MHWSGRDWGWDSQFTSFLDRFEAVATTLRRSKAAVCSLLESDYMARLAAHPRREYRRKENNRSQNAERNAQVFVGRHAIGTGQVQVGQTGDLQDRDGNVVAAAGTVHSGLIEQTRKLGEMSSRRESAAKRVKTSGSSPTTSPERNTTGDAEGSLNSKEPSPKASQKKPRVRNRKIAAKTDTAATEPTTKVPAGAAGAENVTTDQDQSMSDKADFVSADQATFIPTSSAPFSWSGGNNITPSATAAPITSFADQIPWPSTTTYGMLPHTVSSLDLSHSNTGFGTSNNDFPSAITDFSALNSDANLNHYLRMTGSNTFTLPFRPAPNANAGNQSGTASSNPGGNGASTPNSPNIVTGAPIEDVFKMNIAIDTGANGGGDTTVGTTTVTLQQPTIQAPMDASQWASSVEEMDMYYEMALLNSNTQNLLGANYTGEVDTASPSSGTDLDMSMFTIPDDLMWAINNNNVPVQFGDGSNPGHTGNGEI